MALLPDAQGCEDEAIDMGVYEAVRDRGGLLEAQGERAAVDELMIQLKLMDPERVAEQTEG